MPVFLDRFVMVILAGAALAIALNSSWGFLTRVGSIAALTLIAFLIAFWLHRQQERKTSQVIADKRSTLSQFVSYARTLISSPAILVVLLTIIGLLVVAIAGRSSLPVSSSADTAVVAAGGFLLWCVLLWKRLLILARGARMWPVIGIIVGLLLVIGCIVWMYADIASETRNIQSSLKRYVLPRQLTEKQINTIGEHLAKYEPHRVKMVLQRNSEEVSCYHSDLHRALMKGGWQEAETAFEDHVQEGISLLFEQPLGSARSPQNTRRPNAKEILEEALSQADVAVNGVGGSSSDAIREPKLTIMMGLRRMDDIELVGREHSKLLRQLAQIELRKFSEDG